MNKKSLESADVDATFGLVCNSRRRRFLRELRRAGEERELHEIARRIAAAEQGLESSDTDPPNYRSVYVSLYQTHVPKLADHGVISYDPDSKTVSLVACPTTRRMFELVDGEAEQTWTRYYTVEVLLGVGLLAVVALAGETDVAWRLVAGVVGVVTAGPAVVDGVADARMSQRFLSRLPSVE